MMTEYRIYYRTADGHEEFEAVVSEDLRLALEEWESEYGELDDVIRLERIRDVEPPEA